MKCKVAIGVLTVVIFVSVQAENIMEIIRDCKEKNSCNEDIIKKMKAHDGPLTDECFCALGCIGKEKGIFTDTNGIDKDKLRAILKRFHLPQDKIDAIVEKCDLDNADDECAAAKALTECMKP